jgi:hypothetical protein
MAKPDANKKSSRPLGTVVSGRPSPLPPEEPDDHGQTPYASQPTGCDSTMSDVPAPPPVSPPDLDGQITLAITTAKAPPGTNHQLHPTWYEKILMYDPLVLEDLAAWLNTEGLPRIFDNRKVTALQVRDWCERHSIVCYGIGGGGRRGYTKTRKRKAKTGPSKKSKRKAKTGPSKKSKRKAKTGPSKKSKKVRKETATDGA